MIAYFNLKYGILVSGGNIMKIKTLDKFPDQFLWGASSSSFQVEGAYDEDGKGLSVMDTRFVPEGISDTKFAADHYHRYKSDVQLMKEAGLKSYRFSIAWARIFPRGDEEKPNQKGIDFYNSLINELKKAGIEPVATLYHWDMPDYLDKEYQGWRNRKVIDFFAKYAKTCFEAFGDRVKYWISINEQMMMVMNTSILLNDGETISEKQMLKMRMEACLNMSLAEKKVTQLCHDIVKDGKIGPSSAYQICYPATCDSIDVEAAIDAEEFLSYLVLDLSVRGEFPVSTKVYLQENNAYPEITEEDDKLLKSVKPDFIGLNYYASVTVRRPAYSDPKADLWFFNTENYTIVNNPIIRTTKWLRGSYDPLGLKLSLRKLDARYRLPLMITENGYPQEDVVENEQIHDQDRIEYLNDHLRAIKEAISMGVDVIGYNIWAFMDVLSAGQGFKKRYGLVYVDHQEGNQGSFDRLKKDSYFWYQKQIKEKGENI